MLFRQASATLYMVYLTFQMNDFLHCQFTFRPCCSVIASESRNAAELMCFARLNLLKRQTFLLDGACRSMILKDNSKELLIKKVAAGFVR